VHTNSILICFCSILYYRDLAEHIRRYKIEKEIVKALDAKNSPNKMLHYALRKFRGKLTNETFLKEKYAQKKTYNHLVLNRWHIMLRLHLNKELIQYRRHNLKTKPIRQPLVLFTKMKLFFRKKKVKI